MEDKPETCPRCGEEVEYNDPAPCLCPHCGARICEGTV